MSLPKSSILNPQPERTQRNRQNAFLVYTLLATLNLATIVISLWFSHQLMINSDQTTNVTIQWVERMKQIADLNRSANAVAVPGNDVFLSNDVALESAKLSQSIAAFKESMDAMRGNLAATMPTDDFLKLSGHLTAIEDAVDSIPDEAGRIFTAFGKGKIADAGARMASMDRIQADVNSWFDMLEADFSAIQTEKLQERILAMEESKRFEHVLIGFIVATLFGLTAYGCYLCGKMRRWATELRQKNIELHEQNLRVEEAARLKSQFLANMSHELRTPLNAIVGLTEMIIDEKVGAVTTEQRGCLDDVLSSATHLLELINDVLDLSKVEARKMEFHPEPVDLAKLTGEVRDVLRGLAAQKRIRMDVLIDPSVQNVMIDSSRLKQVLYNYLSNALKFTPDGGQVTIRVTPHGSAAFKIEVEDTGIGIAAEDIEKLFSEFHQLDAGMSKKYQGTGLGLALTKRIVEAQNGKVTVESTVGKGSVFGAILPRTNGIPLSYLFDQPAAPLRNPDAPAILVIEDDTQERSWLLETITEAGYIVETASTGAQALSRISSRKFDAVTLDLLLPDMSGWDVLRKLRGSGPNQNTPVIITTLVSERDSAAGFVVHDFLTKPIEAEQLLASIEKATVEPNAHRPLLLVEP